MRDEREAETREGETGSEEASEREKGSEEARERKTDGEKTKTESQLSIMRMTSIAIVLGLA